MSIFYWFQFLSFLFNPPENDLICDCRLSWLIELKNQTKNEQLKEALDAIECSLKKQLKDPMQHHHKASRISHNAIDQPHQVTAEEDPEYYDDEPDGKTFFLTSLTATKLPCPTDESDPTELPLSRESIGFDMSWVKVVTSSSSHHQISALLSLVVVMMSLNILRFCWIIDEGLIRMNLEHDFLISHRFYPHFTLAHN